MALPMHTVVSYDGRVCGGRRHRCRWIRVGLLAGALSLPAGAAPLRYAGFFPADSPPATQDDERDADRAPPHEPRGAASRYGPGLQNLIDEFVSTSSDIKGRPGGETAVDFKAASGRPNWFQVLLVTRDDNPLMSRACKQQAVRFSVDSMRQAMGIEDDDKALKAAAMHIQEHLQFAQRNRVSYSDYLKALAECREFCAPLVAQLANCHILSVARRTHGIVLFPFDSAELDRRYREQGSIVTRIRQHLDASPQSKVLLIGRASKVGSLKYNRRLAAQRVLSVRDALLEKGVHPERIETMWFGWEPPQITPFVAAEYGLKTLMAREGARRMNQSVMMVLY